MSEAVAEAEDIILSEAELERICGGLTQPRRQVHELQRQGFWRARLVNGECILEREHYKAVCAGAVAPASLPSDTGERPRVLP